MATTNYNLPTISDNMAADVVRDHNALAVAVDTAVKTVENGVNAKTQVATTAEAQAGTDNTKIMTPLRVAEITNPIKSNALYTGAPTPNILNIDYTTSFEIYAPDATILPSAGDWYVDVDVFERNKAFRKIIARRLGEDSIYCRTITTSSTGTWVRILNQNDYDVLFQSVSNGKAQVASAITGKGISTASDASFATMASNINAIQTTSPPIQTFASGTGSVNTGNYNISVSNLPFAPSVIMVTRGVGNNNNNGEFLVYMKDGIFPSGTSGIRSMKVVGGGTNISASSLVTLTSNGFTANIQSMFVSGEGTYAWVAYK